MLLLTDRYLSNRFDSIIFGEFGHGPFPEGEWAEFEREFTPF